MNHQQITDFINQLPETWLDFPFGEDLEVYKYGRDNDGVGKMFAIVKRGSRPVKLSLKSDPLLARTLRDRYETVLPGENLNKNHWNTIICSGQLEDDDIKDLIRHAYEIVKNN